MRLTRVGQGLQAATQDLLQLMMLCTIVYACNFPHEKGLQAEPEAEDNKEAGTGERREQEEEGERLSSHWQHPAQSQLQSDLPFQEQHGKQVPHQRLPQP